MRCSEITIKTVKKKDFPDEDTIELTVPYGGKDLKVLVIVGEEALWVRDVNEQGEAGEGTVLRFDEHAVFDEMNTEPAPVFEGHGPTPSDCGERGGGNQPPEWRPDADPAYLAAVASHAPPNPTQDWAPSVELPLERVRRTDDGTYPNVGEELAKVNERAEAGSGGTYSCCSAVAWVNGMKAPHASTCKTLGSPERKVGYGRGVLVTSTSEFVPGLGPTHAHNQSVAEKKGLVYDEKYGVYRNLEGYATHDKQGQKLPYEKKP